MAVSTGCMHQQDEPGAAKVPLLWSEDHKEVVISAKSLLDHPQIQLARQKVLAKYSEAPAAQITDGRSRLAGGVDELVYGILLATVNRELEQPKLVWTETMPYSVGDIDIPGSRYAGDMPDRIYRNVVVDPGIGYELRGRLNRDSSIDFSIEAIPGPGNWGIPPLAILQSKDIDTEANGDFVITLDASPAGNRSNHLQLPKGTRGLLIRDTIADWQKHKPVPLSITSTRAEVPGRRNDDQLAAIAAATIEQAATFSRRFFDGIWARDTNAMDTYVRDLGWGIVAINRFSIADDEALVVTIDPLSARYFGIQVDDLWLRSLDYTKHISTLNTLQADANDDGSYTFVVAPRDPGYVNWVDTATLNDGYLIGRWELFERPTDGEGAVRAVRKVNVRELESVLPKRTRSVTPQQRREMLSSRKAAYDIRLGH